MAGRQGCTGFESRRSTMETGLRLAPNHVGWFPASPRHQRKEREVIKDRVVWIHQQVSENWCMEAGASLHPTTLGLGIKVEVEDGFNVSVLFGPFSFWLGLVEGTHE